MATTFNASNVLPLNFDPNGGRIVIGKDGIPRQKRKYKQRKRTRSPSTIARSKKQRRLKANDRERNRMHNLNDALERLRAALPPISNDDGSSGESDGNSKLTKIETLRFANQYIRMLTELLQSNTSSRCAHEAPTTHDNTPIAHSESSTTPQQLDNSPTPPVEHISPTLPIDAATAALRNENMSYQHSCHYNIPYAHHYSFYSYGY